uniref:Uncharacterized protein n=1 Tax=Tetranychus urticae TaxID=32264 RepID=T1JZI4_TETUR
MLSIFFPDQKDHRTNASKDFKIGYLDRTPSTNYDPIRKKFTGQLSQFFTKQMERYSSINYTIVFRKPIDYGECNSGNCTGLIGLVQRGEADFCDRLYSFATIPDSTTGLKPGTVLGDLSCTIFTALPEIGIVREDVFTSLSIFPLDVILSLAFLFLFLSSIPFLLWYFNPKLFNIKTTSPWIIWPLICAILRQAARLKTLFSHLSSEAAIKTIDSLEDVADCGRIPVWMEEPLCRTMVYSGSPRAQQEIFRRGLYRPTGPLMNEFITKKEAQSFVFIVTPDQTFTVRMGYCIYNHGAKWHRSKNSFPVHLLFTVLNSKLPPHASKFLNIFREKQFQSGIDFYIAKKWQLYLEKRLDPKQIKGCYHKTAISPNPVLAP